MTVIITPVPKSPFAELRNGPTGKPTIYITREWYRYLTSLTTAVGGNTDVIVEVITNNDYQQASDLGPVESLASSADSFGSQLSGRIEGLTERFSEEIPFPMPPTELGSLIAAENVGSRIIAAGSAVLVAGTVVVNNINANSVSEFSLTAKIVGGTQGILSVGAIVAGTSFVINSSNAADTSTVSWVIFGKVKG